MKAAAIYTRISQDREGQSVGVDRQAKLCQDLADAAGLDVVEVFSDNDLSASTGSTKARPDYKRMVEAAKAGEVSTIVAYSSSRLTRRPLEHEGLIQLAERHGVRYRFVVSPTFDLNTADGRQIARILAATDAAEAERTSERVRAAKAAHRAAGRQSGGWRPYGYRIEQDTLTVDEVEAEHVRAVCHSLLAGESIHGITASLNADGVPCATGKPWNRPALQRVLKSRHLAGLVGDETATAVQHLLSDPARRTTRGPQRRHLLSGIAKCGVCGGPVNISRGSRGNGRGGTYGAYQCAEAKHVVRHAEALDRYIGEVVVARLSRPDTADLFATTGPDTNGLHAEAAELRGRLDALAALFADGAIDAAQLGEGSRRLRSRLDEGTRGIANAVRSAALSAAYSGDPATVWAGLSLEQRRELVAVLMTVTIHPARGRPAGWKVGQSWFDPATIEVTPR